MNNLDDLIKAIRSMVSLVSLAIISILDMKKDVAEAERDLLAEKLKEVEDADAIKSDASGKSDDAIIKEYLSGKDNKP